MSKFKVGDRVRVYTSFSEPNQCGLVVEADDATGIAVKFDGDDFDTFGYHPKQCRKLKPKAKPREFWINLYQHDATVYKSKSEADEAASEERIERIHVREVKEK